MNELWNAAARPAAKRNEMTQIPIARLRPFTGHPYKVLDNEEIKNLTESIREHGVLTPLIVRPLEVADEYEVISGHRRLHAAQKAGLETVPAFIHTIDRNTAAIELVDSNLHRERLLPSEKAFAYKLKLEALNHRGSTCGQVGHKSRDDVSKTESGRTVQRYIRLTYLIPSLLNLVDEGRIAFSVGVELSYLDKPLQKAIAEIIQCDEVTPSYSQAVRMHKLCNDRALDAWIIQEIMAEEKPNQRERVSLPMEQLRRFFPSDYSPKEMQNAIFDLLEKERRRRQDRGAR